MHKHFPTLARAALAAFLAALATAAKAQTTDTPQPQAPQADNSEQAQQVEVESIRDPAMMPYRKAYDFLKKIDAAGGDRVTLRFRATSSTTHQPIPGLKISLQGESSSLHRLDIAPDGFFTVPFVQSAYDEDAAFLSNQKKGSLDIGFFIFPRLAAEGFGYGEVVDAVGAGRRVVSGIVPWYLRIFNSSISAVGVCYPDDGHVVTVAAADSPVVERPAADKAVDTRGATVYCANFSASEPNLARDARITPQTGWEGLFR